MIHDILSFYEKWEDWSYNDSDETEEEDKLSVAKTQSVSKFIMTETK